MQRFSVIAVFGCLAVSLCQAKCPTPHLADEDFDLSKLTGNWLATYNFPNRAQKYCKCNSLFITEDSPLTGATMTSSCYNTKTEKTDTRLAYLDEIHKNGKIVGKVIDGAGNDHPLEFYLAATDYDNYAVLYSCSRFGEFAAILSRDGHTSPAVKAAVDEAMSKHGVDPSKFISIVQDCSE